MFIGLCDSCKLFYFLLFILGSCKYAFMSDCLVCIVKLLLLISCFSDRFNDDEMTTSTWLLTIDTVDGFMLGSLNLGFGPINFQAQG